LKISYKIYELNSDKESSSKENQDSVEFSEDIENIKSHKLTKQIFTIEFSTVTHAAVAVLKLDSE
jgi:hypothetical protein